MGTETLAPRSGETMELIVYVILGAKMLTSIGLRLEILKCNRNI